MIFGPIHQFLIGVISKGIFIIALLFSVSIVSTHAQTAPYKEWDKRFGGSENDNLSYPQQIAGGGYILGGYSKSGISGDKTEDSQGNSDYWIVKTDALGSKLWDKRYGGNSDDALSCVLKGTNGGYILAGHSSSNISGDKTEDSQGLHDYWIVETDSNGIKLWDKRFGGSNYEYLYSIQQTDEGAYILGGSSYSDISGDKTEASQGLYDYWIVKMDTSGNKLWDKRFGGSEYDILRALLQTSDGGYILGGYSHSGISGDKTQTSQGYWDYWIVKTDAEGNKLWDKSFGGSGSDYFTSIQLTADGGYILAGGSWSGISGDKTEASQGEEDFWIVKTDAGGAKEWDKRYGGSGTDEIRSIHQTADGGYILGGISTSDISGDKTEESQGDSDYWMVKTDAVGNKLWDKRFGGIYGEHLNTLQQTADGGYILSGYSVSGISGDKTETSQGNEDFWIVKTTPECAEWYYADADGDEFGNPNVFNCGALSGYVSENSDCDDNNVNVYPGAIETVGNGIDDDCDGSEDETCYSNFFLLADTLIPHHYWGINQSSGTTPVSYLWSWGDGLFDSIPYPSHTYGVGGYYTICLSVQDSTGCLDSICIPYDIQKLTLENTIAIVDIVQNIPTSSPVSEEGDFLSLFPNPTYGNISIKITSDLQYSLSIKLFDMLGKEVYSSEEGVVSGNFTKQLDLNHLPSSAYFLKVRYGELSIHGHIYEDMRKVVILR